MSGEMRHAKELLENRLREAKARLLNCEDWLIRDRSNYEDAIINRDRQQTIVEELEAELRKL